MRFRRENITGTESYSNDNIAVGSVSQETLEAYIRQNHKLDITPEELATRLDNSFVRAIEAQADALKDGGEEVKRRADIVALLAACEGMGNKKVFNKHGDYAAKGYVSVNDFKLSQIEAVLINVGPAEDAGIIEEAVRNICSVYQIDFSISRVDAMKMVIKENRHIQRVVATTAFVAATGVASVVVASPAAADDMLIVNTNPTKPSPHVNEIANGDVVKIAAKTINKSQQDLAPSVVLEDVVTVKPAPAKIISAPESEKASAHITDSDDVVRISRKTIDAPKKITGKVPINQSEKPDAPVITIKPIPVAPTPKVPPAEANKAAAPEAGATAIPEVIVDPALAGETLWSPDDLAKVRENLDVYLAVQKETTVPWEVMAALHEREYDLLVENPKNGQGIFQLYSSTERFAPGPVSKDEFKRQAILAANFLKEKAKMGAVYGELLLSDPDKVKDVLFSYNGRAAAYAQQAKNLGYDHPAEGSPYVMNLADDKRNSLKNSRWGQILTDGGPLGTANQKPGAWPLIEGLVKVNKISHDQIAEKAAAADIAKKAADEKAAADADQTKRASQQEKTVEEFSGWKLPVPEGSRKSAQYEGHKGQDYAVKAGTPFYASVGGTVKVLTYDVRDEQFCKTAFEKIGASMDVIKDPIQKEVRITRMIGDDKYEVIYAHMSEIDVEDGVIVSAGQEIGKTGNSGCSTGDHAHWEVRKNGVAIDPNSIFDGDRWRSMGEVKRSSSDTYRNDADSHENGSDQGDSSHQHSVSDTTKVIDGSPGPAEINPTLEVGVDNSLTDDQKRRLAAIKQVAELKKRMVAATEQKRDATADDGYLSVRR
jgi:murein DD-endopeptidase MepM/ murein hydrolase activator NlpD